MKTWRLFFSLAIIPSWSLAAEAENSTPPKTPVPTKQLMGEIYEALAAVLPFSTSEKKFENPAIRESIKANLKTIAEKANILPDHTEFHDASFRYLGQSLARDAKDLYDRFDKNRTKEALFLVDSMTDNCVACHSRSKAPDSSRASGLFKNLDLASLSLDEKAKLYLVTRQFDKSLKAYREILLSDEYRIEEICVTDWIDHYLTISIGIKRDFNEAKSTLARFQKRPGLPMFVDRTITNWLESIDQLAAKKAPQANLAEIRKIINAGKAKERFPLDHQGQIHYLLASSLLQEYVGKEPKGKAAAEAYLLLGFTETMTRHSLFVSQNENYYETAIRSAPGSKFAEDAYQQLEEAIMFEYSGSAGLDLPDDVRTRLKELKALSQSANSKPKL